MPSEEISQCPHCLCMTKTVDGKCGKCKGVKMTNELKNCKVPASFDAKDWAEEFNNVLVSKGKQPYDPDWLIGFFANALMRGYDEGMKVQPTFRGMGREKLAELAHKSWSGWIKYMFSKMERQHNGDWWIPKWAYERWTRQANTEYKDLSEEEKNSDRAEADAILSNARGVDLAKLRSVIWEHRLEDWDDQAKAIKQAIESGDIHG